jgi:hypothetical protein
MLRKEGEKKPKPQPVLLENTLPLGDIRTATSVFQPRLGDGARGEAEAHVSALADAIRSRKDHRLDPIIVWWSGKHWRVIDGHHRLVAYNQVSNPSQEKASRRCIPIDRVPVEIFVGSLQEAMARATIENSKDKLRMTKKDKLERAWRFTALGQMTIPEIANATCVAERTVSNMRKVIADLNVIELGDWTPRIDPLDITWAEAKRQNAGEVEVTDEWLERQAREWATRLARTFGDRLARNPEIAMRTLEIYSENLVNRLAAIWMDEQGSEEDSEEQDEEELAAPC